MQLRNFRTPTISAEQPFAGQGVSAYAAAAIPIQYRNLSFRGAGFHQRLCGSLPSVTTRVASAAGTANDEPELTVGLSAYAPGVVYLDLRHFRDGIENETTHPQRLELDESGNIVSSIRGSAFLLSIEQRTGGILRISWQYLASDSGGQPETFELIRTSGPASPATVVLNASGSGIYTFDTEGLDDTDTYDFRIDAVIAAVLDEEDVEITSEVRVPLLTLADLQADASGPPAVTGLTLEAV